MSTFYIRLIIGLFILNNAYKINAQDNSILFWEPELAANYKVSEKYSFNFGVKKRSFLYEKSNTHFELRNIDISHFSTLKTGVNQSISLGIMYRYADPFERTSNELRVTEQFNSTKRTNSIRYGHRFRTEQRNRNKKITHRFRYRFAIDLPLNGEKLDVGESYMVTSSEILLSLERQIRPQLDNRIDIEIGWLLQEGLKLQTGLEYRFENFTQNTQHILFLLSKIVVSL